MISLVGTVSSFDRPVWTARGACNVPLCGDSANLSIIYLGRMVNISKKKGESMWIFGGPEAGTTTATSHYHLLPALLGK